MRPVASFAEAWIETLEQEWAHRAFFVASFAEAWIETVTLSRKKVCVILQAVASFAEEWIETYGRSPKKRPSSGRLLRGGVDRNTGFQLSASGTDRRLLRGGVDRNYIVWSEGGRSRAVTDRIEVDSVRSNSALSIVRQSKNAQRSVEGNGCANHPGSAARILAQLRAPL